MTATRNSSASTSSALSCDPVYRALVADSRKNPAVLGVVSDYREERGLPRLAARPGKLARKEARRPAAWIPPWTPEEEAQRLTLKKLQERVVAVGRDYHRHVRGLYASKHGDVLYGRGGQETTDSDRYSKKWHGSYGAARNLNGGARIEGTGRKARIVLENHRGKEVVRLPMPPKKADLAMWIREVL